MRVVVVGGGIAGVCCARELARLARLDQQQRRQQGGGGDGGDGDGGGETTAAPTKVEITLLTASAVVKDVERVVHLTPHAEEVTITERDARALTEREGGGGGNSGDGDGAGGNDSSLKVVLGVARSLDVQKRQLAIQRLGDDHDKGPPQPDQELLPYDALVVAAGARPRPLPLAAAAGNGQQQQGTDPRAAACVVTVRDTESVTALAGRLARAGGGGGGESSGGGASVVVVGNGGIALELVGALMALGAEGGGEREKEENQEQEEKASKEEQQQQEEQPPKRRRDGGPAAAAAKDEEEEKQEGDVLEVVWVVKHGHVGDSFFDADAAEFLLRQMRRVGRRRGGAAGVTEGGEAAPAAAAKRPRSRGGDGEPQQQQQPPEQPQEQQQTLPQGHGAGPKWTDELRRALAAARGSGGGAASPPLRSWRRVRVRVERRAQVAEIAAADDAGDGSSSAATPPRARVTLTTGDVVAADAVVAAVGVEPAAEWVPAAVVQRAPDGGLLVDRRLRTSAPRVYAAGDVATAGWALDPPLAPRPWPGGDDDEEREEGGAAEGGSGAPRDQWFQMRLWSQARVMGTYAAHCVLGRADDLASGFNFELFTHVTRFMGLKVVLLGRYNGQGLDHEPAADLVSYSRTTGDDDDDEEEEGGAPAIAAAPRSRGHGGGCCGRRGHGASAPEGPTFVRVLLLRGRMVGAVLIGETDLEETFENLILDGLDVGRFGPALLDPSVELDHVFD